MAEWQLRGTYIEFCNCEPGCGCNFVGSPNSPEGNCEAVISHRIDRGSYGDLDLSGAKVAWALWWPGAIHDRGGHGHVFVDCETDEQFDVLRRIWRGEEGYGLFEIFNSTLTEPSAVERASVDLKVDGRSSTVKIEGGAGEAAMTPLRNPVSGEESDVRIVKTGFIWRDGAVAQSEMLRVDLPEMKYEISGRHAVFAQFGYSNEGWVD